MLQSNHDSRPKFVMQFTKQQPLPKLVSINDNQQLSSVSYDQPTHSNNIANSHTIYRKYVPKQRNYRLQVIQLQKQLQQERQQRAQFQQIIKELTVKSERLKQINEHLIQRLKQVQKSYISNRIQLEKQNQIQLRKQKQQIYYDIEDYLRNSVQSLSHSLKSQRMNPTIQKKIQQFMQEILQINSYTVQMVNLSRRKNTNLTNPNTSVYFDTSNLLNQQSFLQRERLNSVEKRSRYSAQKSQYNTLTGKSRLGPEPNQYNTIMKHLHRQVDSQNVSQNFYNSKFSNFRTQNKDQSGRRNNFSEQKSIFRHQYSTTPHKRKKIFNP